MTTRTACLLAVAVVAVLYGHHIAVGQWVYEDEAWLTASITSSRPLTQATWYLVHSPQAAHALNVGLHLILCTLVGLLASSLGLSQGASLAAGALLLVHPLTVESVAYAASRAELLAAIGVVVACLCAVRDYFWRSLAVACLAMAAKESAVIVLLVMPLVYWARRMPDWPYCIGAYTIPLFAGLIVIGPSTLANLGEAVGMRITWHEWLLLQAAGAFKLLGLALWPFSGGFTVDHDYDVISQSGRYVALAGLCGVGLAAILAQAWDRRVAFGLVWALLAILPRLVVQTPRSLFNEHQMLVALIGVILAGVAAWDAWPGG